MATSMGSVEKIGSGRTVGSVELVRHVYERFGQGDVAAVLAAFDPGVEWRLAEGHPYSPDGAAWSGPAAVARNFFARAGGEWEGFAIAPAALHDAGDAVVVECRYRGVYRATGRRLDAQACHVWGVRAGKITRFQQYIDTAQLQRVMGAD
jgi:ketosteroid isomerase-like protein